MSGSGGAVGGLFGEVGLEEVDEVAEAIGDGDGLEDDLPCEWIVDQEEGDEVGEVAGVGDVFEATSGGGGGGTATAGLDQLLEEFRSGGRFLAEARLDEFEKTGPEGVDGDGIGVLGDDGGDLVDAIRFVADDLAEADAGDALKDEVGGAVWILDGGADESEAGDGQGGFAGVGGFLHGDAEHPVGIDGLGEHGAVARFEDEQGKHGLWEQDRATQDHDAGGIRHEHGGG